MVRPVRGFLSQACTARAARRNEQGKGARAPFDGRRCCSTRFGPCSFFSFDAYTPGPSLRSSCNKARAPFETSDCAAASAEVFVGTWLQRLSCRRRACCVLSHEAFVLSLSRVRATQAATNGARARAHLLIVAVSARSLSYRRVRLDLASCFGGKMVMDLVRSALSQARTARAGRRNEQGKGARAPFDGRRCCSTRFGPRSCFSFDACTPGPSLGAGAHARWLRRSTNFRFTLPGVCPPNPTDPVKCPHHSPRGWQKNGWRVHDGLWVPHQNYLPTSFTAI